MSTPKYPKFATLDSRLRSFADPYWAAARVPVTRLSLAQAGFFYSGRAPWGTVRQERELGIIDGTTCFHCGVVVCLWEEADHPEDEHRRFRPDCQFLASLPLPPPVYTTSGFTSYSDGNSKVSDWMCESEIINHFSKRNPRASLTQLRNTLHNRWMKKRIPFRTVSDLEAAYSCQTEWLTTRNQLIDDSCTQKREEDERQRRAANECIVCVENQKNTLILPCRHLIVCERCFGCINRCPYCRARITTGYVIYSV